MQSYTFENRIRKTLATILNVQEKSIPDDAKINQIENWDSLNHIQLMIALEREFGVRLSPPQVIRLISLDAIIDYFDSTDCPAVECHAEAPATVETEFDSSTLPQALEDGLREVQVSPGDLVLAHSFIGSLIQPPNIPEAICRTVLGTIQKVLGSEGTLVFPTFSSAFTSTGEFDRDQTPSEMGILTEYFRTIPGVRSTLHPYHRFSMLGRYTQDLIAADCPSSFGPGSPIDEMARLGGKILLISVGWDVCTFFHYVEEQFEVPYRFYKDFMGTVTTNGNSQMESWQMYVRDVERSIRNNFDEFGKRVDESSLSYSATAGLLELKSIGMKELFDFTYQELERTSDCLISPLSATTLV